ncbi:hypothetical protein E2C01_017671 [Portunus trituberculatus]|uniref:Uncharacterized protein n=1 Tax=Portunus trituberculatus TaxID=210409 RepID=A0A5B7DTI2_PORTR|nr:hypothetical protein [Portunus trituberculatus]
MALRNEKVNGESGEGEGEGDSPEDTIEEEEGEGAKGEASNEENARRKHFYQLYTVEAAQSVITRSRGRSYQKDHGSPDTSAHGSYFESRRTWRELRPGVSFG